MITVKRFMKLNPSVKDEEHARRLINNIKEQQENPPHPEANKMFAMLAQSEKASDG